MTRIRTSRLEAADYTIDWRRQTGAHLFELTQGESLTALSYNSWEEFADELEGLPASTSGTVLSPELMTAADMELHEIHERQNEIEHRIETARRLSEGIPRATLLLGTAAWRGKAMTNSQLMIENGQIIEGSQIDKKTFVGAEYATFSNGPQRQLGATAYQAICADIIGLGVESEYGSAKNILKETIKTVLVSACWAVADQSWGPRKDEPRFRGHLETVIGSLFTHLPKLEDVVITDRTFPLTNLPPFNMHASRTDHRQPQSDVR